MSTVGVKITAEMMELRELQAALGRIFSPEEKTKILRSILTKAVQPTLVALRAATPKGPTGNLRAAAMKKIVPYTRQGRAVALVGYRMAGRAESESVAGGRVRATTKGDPDRAFHQYWLEQGTDERVIDTPAKVKAYTRRSHTRRHPISGTVYTVKEHEVKGQGENVYYASSFNSLGPFRIIKGSDGRVQTEPGYPFAFFKKSKTPISLHSFPVGGSSGQPPLQTAWDQTKTEVATILSRELRVALESAVATLIQRTGAAAA